MKIFFIIVISILLASCKTTPGADENIEFFLDSRGAGVVVY